MRNIEHIRSILLQHKNNLLEKYGLNYLAVFGSYARNQQSNSSDIDILVDFKRPIGIEFIDLAEELEKILSTKVDLVSRNALKDAYYQAIEKDLMYV